MLAPLIYLQGSDEAEDGHTYAEYKSLQVRAMHPEIMGHPGALWGVHVCPVLGAQGRPEGVQEWRGHAALHSASASAGRAP